MVRRAYPQAGFHRVDDEVTRMRAQHRAVLATLAVIAGFMAPAHAQAGPARGPIVWTPALPSNEGWERLAAFPDGVVYAQYGQGYARSADFGANWSFEQGPDGETGSSGMLRWMTPTRGVAVVNRVKPALRDPVTHKPCALGVAYFALDVTLDGGHTWSPACSPVSAKAADVTDPLGFSVDGLYVSRRDSSVMVEGDFSSVSCRSVADIHPMLFISPDLGRSWRTITLPGGYMGNLLGYDIYDARHVVVFAARAKGTCKTAEGGDMYAFATSDGVHFKRIFRCPGVRYCTSGAWVTPYRLLIGLDDGQLFVSNDQGRHFFKGALLRDADYDPLIESGTVDPRMFWAQALSFSDDLHGFASTRGSGTWRTVDGGLRWVQEKSPECVYYPFGVGDVSAADSEHGITGGPPSLDIRQPGDVELGCLAPQNGGPQVSSDTIVATEPLVGATTGVGRLSAAGRPAVITR